MPVVEIPGVGAVEFPDSMSTEAIQTQAARLARPEADAGGGINPLAVAAAGAGVGAVGVGGSIAAKRVLGSRGARAVAGQAGKELMRDRGPLGALTRVANAARSAAPAAPNPADARISEAKAMKMEADARAAAAKADLAERRLMPKEPAPADRTTTRRTPKPKPRTKQPPAKIPDRTVPIKVAGKPKAVRLEKQRGVNKREIASRQKGMAASRAPAAADDMMEQLERSLHVEQGMRSRGVPSSVGIRGPVRAGLRGVPKVAGGPLALLLSLLDAGSIPEQMDEAAAISRQSMDPELARILAQQRTIY